VEHTLFKTGDADASAQIKDRNGEVVLNYCRVCGGVEAELPTDCCGRKMNPNERVQVQEGELNFIGRQWFNPKRAAGASC
jgi:hypothetical protein